MIVPPEFSTNMDLMLNNLSEFLNFKIKKFKSHNDYDSKVDYNENLPSVVHGWIENAQLLESTPSKPSS
jgi:hypothetical protein